MANPNLQNIFQYIEHITSADMALDVAELFKDKLCYNVKFIKTKSHKKHPKKITVHISTKKFRRNNLHELV